MKTKNIILAALVIQGSIWLFYKFCNPIIDQVIYVNEVLDNRISIKDGGTLGSKDTMVAKSLWLDVPNGYFRITSGDRPNEDTVIVTYKKYQSPGFENLAFKVENDVLKIASLSNSIFKDEMKRKSFFDYKWQSNPLSSERNYIQNYHFDSIVIGPFTTVELNGYQRDSVKTLFIEMQAGSKLTIDGFTIENLNTKTECGSKLIFKNNNINYLHHTSNGGLFSGIPDFGHHDKKIKNATIIQGEDSKCNSIITLSVSDTLTANLTADNPTQLVYEGNPILKTNTSQKNRILKYIPTEIKRR